MEALAGLSVGLLVLSAGVVTTRTLGLWRRTRGLPELLLGAMLLCATVLGYPLAIASTLIRPTELWPVHVSSQLLFSIGYACLFLFTLTVFRPGALWARALVGVAIASMVVSTIAYALVMSGDDPRRPTEMIGLTVWKSAPLLVAYCWTTVEALAFHPPAWYTRWLEAEGTSSGSRLAR